MNARFWVYINGSPVKLTLKPYQILSWCEWYRTSEGSHAEVRTWEFYGDRVTELMSTTDYDCDGRLDQDRLFGCPVDLLRAREPYPDDSPRDEVWSWVMWPAWERISASQRDYAAEEAGY